ncbi:MAG: hypothetical protein MUO43_09795 [Desulfobacterales bacterium]|nr:hypothetical protein [Desulfobacterales bacterium]
MKINYYIIFLKSILLIVILTVCQGCQIVAPVEQLVAPVKKLEASSDPYRGGTYKAALIKWTSEVRIYRGLDLELKASATFKSPEFREAYANEYVRSYNLNREEKEKLIKDQKEASLIYNDFIMAAYVPDKKWNDFNKKDSIWKIHLNAGNGKKIKPLEIRKIKKIDAVISHFFPYINTWQSIYLVRFPVKLPGTDKNIIDDTWSNIKMVITSVLGTTEMVWNN